jgi:hypothetical protein
MRILHHTMIPSHVIRMRRMEDHPLRMMPSGEHQVQALD